MSATSYEPLNRSQDRTAEKGDHIADDPRGMLYAPLNLSPDRSGEENLLYDADNRWTHRKNARLLNILPDSGDGTLRLRLRAVGLRAMEREYDAVSYMWVPDVVDNKYVAYINGYPVFLRSNIWGFLMHCRDTGFAVRHHYNLCLFTIDFSVSAGIDAICIDQGNTKERNNQVQQMRKIFSYARFVLIWLGEVSQEISLSTTDCALFEQQASRKEQSESEIYDMNHDVLRVICNPYWQRLWIVQEIRLASVAFVVSGVKLPNVVFIASIAETLLATRKARSPELGRQLQYVLTACRIDNLSLSSLVDLCSQHHCSEICDHIFALIGLVKLDAEYKVDYTLSPTQLVRRTLEYYKAEDVSRMVTSDALQQLSQLTRLLKVPQPFTEQDYSWGHYVALAGLALVTPPQKLHTNQKSHRQLTGNDARLLAPDLRDTIIDCELVATRTPVTLVIKHDHIVIWKRLHSTSYLDLKIARQRPLAYNSSVLPNTLETNSSELLHCMHNFMEMAPGGDRELPTPSSGSASQTRSFFMLCDPVALRNLWYKLGPVGGLGRSLIPTLKENSGLAMTALEIQ
ncbi:hypothetical protein LTR56_001555 [Elasticomyces elasticus]|nr:hypothetical protein LTR56_001555 [Elasticomyces elasticus]KAK3668523.1 hypothetical protein LTR22_000409 [Elasticomyces elasticus]KAK4931875.1 hypothetical protein LTR49_001561 [Elasticomyces elasticus]KAK5768593.1 hypothetical protein LTS12_001382 [Elasticomyces elasticus]